MPGDTLYDTDFYAWSQQQAAVLRAMASSTAQLPNSLDIENIAEEIEGVGNSQLSAMESRVRLILAHLIKLASYPESIAAPHWRTEIAVWHDDLLSSITRAMQAKLDMDREWRRGLRQAALGLAEHDQQMASGLPLECPVLLDSLLAEELNFVALVAAIGRARTS